MASTPSFVASANIGFARPTTSNGASDGSGTLETLITAAVSGTRVDRISIRASSVTAAVSSSACVVRLFLTNTLGLEPRLIEEISIPAGSKSSTTLAASASTSFPGGLLMKSGQLLKCCVSVYALNVTQVDIVAYGGDM